MKDQNILQSASKIYNDSVNIWGCYSRYNHYIQRNEYIVNIFFQVIKHHDKYIFANYIKSVSYNGVEKALVDSKYISEATAKELIFTLHFAGLKPREKKDVYTQEEIDSLSKELEEAIKKAEEAIKTADAGREEAIKGEKTMEKIIFKLLKILFFLNSTVAVLIIVKIIFDIINN